MARAATQIFVGVAMLAGTAMAQFPPPSPAPQPPPPAGYPTPGDDNGSAPDRGVARISLMNGNVSVRRSDSGELVAAVLNAPLTATDRLVTGDNSRAEVQFDNANMIRLGPSTEVRFSELAYGRYQIEIAAGTTTFSVLRDSNAQVEISTPSVAVHPLKKGNYRVTVKPDGTSEITVRAGGAEVLSPGGSEQLDSGKTMLARGPASDPEFQMVAAGPADELDRWSAARDRQLERAISPGYVSRDVYGTEDLDPYGRWTNDPQYGNVWVPAVDPGWAPYQCGRWTWVDYYGWTWIGCEPWGWAPYHYGRWFQGSFGWGWYPGPVLSNDYWSPALVGFFGWGVPGVGVGFGFGFGNVGWVPLAPYERFYPWYGAGVYAGFRGGVAVNNIHIVNNTNVASMYRNARVANGVTSMSAGNFGRTSVASSTMIRASASDLARAGMVRGQLPVSPSRESTQFTSRAASTQGMPRTSENTRFSSRMQPSRVEHVPFEQQRQSMTRMAQRSSSGGASRGSFGQPRGSSAPGATGNGGWQRFDQSGRGTASRGYAGQQPVRISPPIVQNRGSSSGEANRPSGSSTPRRGGSSRESAGSRER